MVEAAPSQRKKLNRFTPWVNRLEMSDAELPKVVEVRKTVKQTIFKDSGPIVRSIDSRVLQSKLAVTKGYAERRVRDPIFDAFGIGTGDDAIKGNAHITMLHRDNVWHPHWEVQTEEEDLGTKLRNRQAERKGNDLEGTEIADLKSTVENLEKNQREDTANDAIGQPKKRTFDAKALQAKKALQDTEEEKKIPDPKGIRLTEIPNSVTEQELLEECMAKFGPVERCFMPMEQMRIIRNRGFAIINFKKQEHAERAIQEGEISINFAAV